MTGTLIRAVEKARFANFRHFHKTLPHGKRDNSAPQIARDTNDGDSESWEHRLQASVSIVVASYDRYVGESR